MFISIRKYIQIWKAIAALASRPYVQEIIENTDGTVTFVFVQNGKIFNFIAERGDVDSVERILN